MSDVTSFNKRENKVFNFIVSTTIVFSLILMSGAVWGRMMDDKKVSPILPLEDPIVPLNDCGEYQYTDCQRDYNRTFILDLANKANLTSLISEIKRAML